MAFVTAETQVIKTAGYQPAMTIVFGTYTNSAGGTGGIISPGYTNSSGTLTAITNAESVGCRKIIDIHFRPTTNDATAPGAAVAYNTTRDRDEATIVTTADSTGTYVIFCRDNGA